jgi:hypothetical protein
VIDGPIRYHRHMNVALRKRMSVDDYLAWADTARASALPIEGTIVVMRRDVEFAVATASLKSIRSSGDFDEDQIEPSVHVWMAPAWQEIIWRAAQRSLAVMCPAC